MTARKVVDQFRTKVNEAEHAMVEKLAADAVKELSATLKEITPRLDVEEKPHCGRCDLERRRLIKFTSPNGETHYLCTLCVAQEDKREKKFSPLWKRSRRPPRVH